MQRWQNPLIVQHGTQSVDKTPPAALSTIITPRRPPANGFFPVQLLQPLVHTGFVPRWDKLFARLSDYESDRFLKKLGICIPRKNAHKTRYSVCVFLFIFPCCACSLRDLENNPAPRPGRNCLSAKRDTQAHQMPARWRRTPSRSPFPIFPKSRYRHSEKHEAGCYLGFQFPDCHKRNRYVFTLEQREY